MGLAFRDISKRYGAVVAIKQAQMEIGGDCPKTKIVNDY